MRTLNTYPIYDLSNLHFKTTKVITSKGEILEGQFVQFKVVKGIVEYLYPSEKYCFLQSKDDKRFWDIYNTTDGEFNEFPSYVRQLSLNDIKEITIYPRLVV
jgi:hypothetical protein